MTEIPRTDKHGNHIVFRPNAKRYRYEVNGEPKKGVTTTIGARFGLNGLMKWAKKLPLTALEWQLTKDGKSKDYIQNFIDKLNKKVGELEIKDATTGTLMHSYCEDYINKRKVVPPTTEPLKTMFSKFTKWWDKKGFQVLVSEQTCYSVDLDCCGTFDVLVKNKKGQIILLDFKTSKNIYSQVPIQVAAYKKLIEDSNDIKIDSYGVVHIPKDDREITLDIYSTKPSYLKAFKACQFLDRHDQAFLKRKRELTKKKGKKNGK